MAFSESDIHDHDHDLNPPRKGHHAHHSIAVGFEKNGHSGSLVPITTPDYEEATGFDDRGNCLAEFEESVHRPRPTRRETLIIFSELWREVIEWVYKPRHPRRVALRFMAMAFCTCPAMVGTKSISSFAKSNGTTKQNMHFVTAEFRKQFGQSFGSVRSELGREHMAEAARMVHQRRQAKQKGNSNHL